jgi:hypothetical protein
VSNLPALASRRASLGFTPARLAAHDAAAPDRFAAAFLREPPGLPRPVSFVEAIRAIIAWLRGTRPSFRQQVRQAKLIEKLSAEFAERSAGDDLSASG